MTYSPRGRPTIYKGVRMRSRLEASHAAWLDACGLQWVYEPQCFADGAGQYLPDFLVDNGDGDLDYTEVKPPTADTSAALLKMHIIRSSQPSANLYVVVPTGVYPNQGWAWAGKCDDVQRCAHCLGTPFRDLRTIPNADRKTIGGRARPEDGARVVVEQSMGRPVPTDPITGRATIGGRARREPAIAIEPPPIEPNWCGQCRVEPCVCKEVDPWDLDDDPGPWAGI